MNLKRRVTIFILALFCHSGLYAVGTAGANFLRYEHSARVVGLGGAFVALADDGDAVYWNPAGLAAINHPIFTFTHSHGFIDNRQEFLNATWPFGRSGTFGVDLLYSSVGDINLYDDFGLRVGKMQNYDLVLDGAWGFAPNKNISFGAGLKYYHSKLAEANARGFALDAGLLLANLADSNFSVGLALQNIGPGITYIEIPDRLPLNLKAGVAQKLRVGEIHGLIFSVEANRLLFKEEWLYLNAGLEYDYLGKYLARCGYRVNHVKDKFSLGFGLRRFRIRMDYALVPFGHLGTTHRISFGYDFPLKTEKPQLTSTPQPIVTPAPPAEISVTADIVLIIPTGVTRFRPFISASNGINHWRLSIYDQNGNPVRDFKGSANLPPTLIWYGKNDLGELVPSGFYSYQLHCRDKQDREFKSKRMPLIIKEVEELTFKLPTAFLFSSGSVTPKKEGIIKVNEIARLIVEHYPTARVRVEGHSDNTRLPTASHFKTNQLLSEIRAQNIANHLAKQGIWRKRLKVLGLGEIDPVADNSTPEGRAQNRRVEIIIEKPEPVIKIRGEVTGQKILFKAGSPYLLEHDLVIEDNASLIIEPGVVLRFGGGLSGNETAESTTGVDLLIKGTLTAKGNKANPIIFEPSSEQSWGAIIFTSSHPDCLLDLCRINGGRLICNGSSPTISNCILENSKGITLNQNSSPLIKDCLLQNGKCGVICQYNSSQLLMDHCFLRGNDAGIILKNFESCEIRSCSFIANKMNLINLSVKSVDASGNFWGTIHPATIEETIYDSEDKAGLGRIIFEPFLIKEE